MKVYRGSNEPKIIKPLNEESEDKTITHIQGENNGKHRPGESEKRTDEIKEVIADDVLTLGAREAALVHGISERTAYAYSNGKQMGDESRARVLDQKHEIKNLALTKLMDTLNLLDPEAVEKEKDRVAIMTGLSKVVDTMEGKETKEGNKVLHLHLYDPGRKSEKDYKTVDV